MNLHEVLHAGSPDLCIPALSITGRDAAGTGLGYLIHGAEKKPSFLISAGTAYYCGGSAISRRWTHCRGGMKKRWPCRLERFLF